MTKCPKCQREQSSSVECVHCGILFEKYEQLSKQPEADDGQPKAADKDSSNRILVWCSLLVIVSISLVAIYFSCFKRPEVVPASPMPATVESRLGTTKETSASSPPESSDSIRMKLAAAYPPRNPLEEARNATVFIQTEWGRVGSGFFIDDKCHIITSRHLVKMEDREVAMLKREQENAGKYVEAITNSISRTRGDTTGLQRILETATAQYNSLEARVEAATFASPSRIKIILFDNTELLADSIRYSSNYDLALLTVQGKDCPFIRPTESSKDLAIGNKLYTIGNPMGIKFTVTAGIFSGWSDFNNERFIKMDAPISPGNSGGPLVTEQGKVVGINTAKYRDAQNIGLAIPIEYALKEFLN